MKKIILFLLGLSNFSINCRANNIFTSKPLLNPDSISCISIKIIDWNVFTFAYFGYNRKCFDEIFEASKYEMIHDRPNIASADIVNEHFIQLFCDIINTQLTDKELFHAGKTPYSILGNSPDFDKDKLGMSGFPLNDDYMETRGKIVFYYKNHAKVEAYISHPIIDIENRSFSMPKVLSRFFDTFALGCGLLPYENLPVDTEEIFGIKFIFYDKNKLQNEYRNNLDKLSSFNKLDSDSIIVGNSNRDFINLFSNCLDYMTYYGNVNEWQTIVNNPSLPTTICGSIILETKAQNITMEIVDKYVWFNDKVYILNDAIYTFLQSTERNLINYRKSFVEI